MQQTQSAVPPTRTEDNDPSLTGATRKSFLGATGGAQCLPKPLVGPQQPILPQHRRLQQHLTTSSSSDSSASASSSSKRSSEKQKPRGAPDQSASGGKSNAIWAELVTLIEPYLDMWSILHLRQTCTILSRHRFKLSNQNWWCRFRLWTICGQSMQKIMRTGTCASHERSCLVEQFPVLPLSITRPALPVFDRSASDPVGGITGNPGLNPAPISASFVGGLPSASPAGSVPSNPTSGLNGIRDPPRLLSFSGFRGYEGSLICDRLVRKMLTLLNSSARSDGAVIDLSHCVLIKDSQLAMIGSGETSPFIPNPAPESRAVYTKLMGLVLDFCPQITDKGLTALLSAHFPHLQYLSLKCVRSELFTGECFKDTLAAVLWPKFRVLNLDFTSLSLEALQAVAEFIQQRSRESNGIGLPPETAVPVSVAGSTLLSEQVQPLNTEPAPRQSMDDIARSKPVCSQNSLASLTPRITFVGSWASKTYLDAIGAKPLIKSFAVALNSGDPDQVVVVKDKADQEIDELLKKRIAELDDPLAPYMLGQGGKYLVNVPVTCPTSEEGGVNVWTLPISVAVQNGRVDMVRGLKECGADLEIIDHLGKSPIYRAVSSGNLEVTDYLLSCGVNLTPLNVLQPTAINAAIEGNYIQITKLLLQHGYPLNFRCPAVKAFKSPLHVACEQGNEELMHSLLDWGANPNSYSGSYKNSPIMLAYKSNPSYLPVFLHGGRSAFTSVALAAEILTSAIAKNDVKSAKLLIQLFPELLTRQHTTWSLPHIQTSKMGKADTLQLILNLQAQSVAPLPNGSHTDRSTFPSPFPLSSPARVQSGFTSLTDGTALERSTNPFLFLPRSRNNIDRQRMRSRLKFWGRNKSQMGPDSKDQGPRRLSTAELKGSPELLPNRSTDCVTQAIGSLEERCDGGQRRVCCSLERLKGWTFPQVSEQVRDFLRLSDVQNGNTALHYAAEEGFNDCVRLLIRHGAELNVENAAGQLPLHLACYEKREETVNLLLCCGSNVNTIDKTSQETPLTSAIRTRNDQLAFLILEHITHRMRHVPTTIGKNLLLSATDQSVSNNNDTKQTQITTGSLPICPLSYALYFGRFEVAAELLKISSQLMTHFPSPTAVKITHDYVREKLAAGGDDVGRRVMKSFLRLYDAQIPRIQSGLMAAPDSTTDGATERAGSSQDEEMSSPDSLADERRCRICEWTAGASLPPGWHDSFCIPRDSARGKKPDINSLTSSNRQPVELSRSRRLHGKLKQAARKPLQLFARSKTPEEFVGNQPTR